MGFDKSESEQLLAACARQCCICGKLHQVQLHHIKPKEKGGTDEIENAIPLCPNCHDEVHTGYSTGRTTKCYSDAELKKHRERTIDQVSRGIQFNNIILMDADISEDFLAKQHNLIFSKFDNDSKMLSRALRMQGRFIGSYGMKQFNTQVVNYANQFLDAIDSRTTKLHGNNVLLNQQVKSHLESYLEADVAFLKEKLEVVFSARMGSVPMTNAKSEGESQLRNLYAQFFLKMFPE